MKTRLISCTKPLIDELETPSDLISYCARVSNPDNQLNTETGERLIRFLVNRKEWSPLQMADFTFEIETTRDMSRQLLRHRSFEFQEFSQRYAEVQDFEWPIECRLQDEKDRQNSIELEDESMQQWWDNLTREVLDVAEKNYDLAIKNGVAKEVARKILPEGLTKSRLYMKGSARSWIHYCALRTGNGTQKEHIEIAKAIADEIATWLPVEDKFIYAEN